MILGEEGRRQIFKNDLAVQQIMKGGERRD